jgi:hypothetical protein
MADTDALILSISADTRQITNALKKLQGDSKDTAKAINDNFASVGKDQPFARAQKEFARSAGAMANDAKILRFQIDDMVSSIASGASPVQALKQQIGEMSKIMTASGGGLRGGVSLLGEALMGMVNPINLAITAFGLALYAAEKFFDLSGEGAKESARQAKEQADQLERVVEKYGDLVPGLKAVRDAQKAVADAAEVKTATQNQIAENYKETLKAVTALLPAVASLQQDLATIDSTSNAPNEVRDAYNRLKDAIDAGTASAKDLQPVIDALTAAHETQHLRLGDTVDSLKALAPALDTARQASEKLTEQEKQATQAQLDFNEAIKKMADIAKLPVSDMQQLLDLYKQAIAAANQLTDIGQRAAAVGTAVAGFRAGEERIDETQAGPTTAKVSLAGRASDAKVAARVDKLNDDFAERLDVLLKEFPSVKVASAFRTFAEQDAIYKSGVRPAARPGRSLHEFGYAADLSPGGMSAADAARMRARAKELGLNFDVPGDPFHVQLTGARIPGDKEAKKPTKELDDWNKKMTESIDLQKQELAINSDSTKSVDQHKAALEEEKLFQEGLNAAIAQHGKVTAEDEAAIRATAHAAAQAGLAVDQLKTSQQEATKASRLHAEEMKQFADAVTQTAQSAIGGFVNDLRNGVSAGEAFHNMLNRIIDGLINMAIQSMFSQNALGGVIGSLFGVGGATAGGFAAGGTVGLSRASDGRRFSPLLWAGAPHYAAGGFVGLRPGEVPIIAHAGEYVIPKTAMGRGGTVSNSSSSTHIGSITTNVATGAVTASTDDGKELGVRINKAIQHVLVVEQRPGGLLRQGPGR